MVGSRDVDDPFRLSFRWAVFYGIGGVPGGAILILFGLAALAPACYSVWVYGEKLSIHWPRLRQSGWTWIGGAVAFVLAATSSANRLELIFSAMGDLFAPAVGAIAGDWLRQRGGWSGLRHGVNRAGVIAWGAGFGVALVLEVDRVDRSRIRPMVAADLDLRFRRFLRRLLAPGPAGTGTPCRGNEPAGNRPVSR